MEETEFSDGQHTIHEGDIGEEFFIIKSGNAYFSEGTNAVARLSSRRRYFGEKALRGDSPIPIQANVIAYGKSQNVQRLPGRLLKSLLVP